MCKIFTPVLTTWYHSINWSKNLVFPWFSVILSSCAAAACSRQSRHWLVHFGTVAGISIVYSVPPRSSVWLCPSCTDGWCRCCLYFHRKTLRWVLLSLGIICHGISTTQVQSSPPLFIARHCISAAQAPPMSSRLPLQFFSPVSVWFYNSIGFNVLFFIGLSLQLVVLHFFSA